MIVFITRPIPLLGINMLKERGYTIKLRREHSVISRKELLLGVRGVDALLCLLTDKIDAEILNAASPRLKVVSNYAVGYDNIDVKTAAAKNIIVANTPCSEVNDAVAEHTFSLMLTLAHRIAEGDAFVRAKKYKGWDPDLLVGQDLYGNTLGLIGLGNIGKGVAKRARGFDMNVVYYDIRRDEMFEKEYSARFLTKEEVLQTSDVVSLHVPLLPTTHHLINTKTLKLMKKNALLINTARGAVVHQEAIAQALARKKLGGYALDVFECEPRIDCDPKTSHSLCKFPSVVMTPHIASATVRARQAMARIAAENIIETLSGRITKNRIIVS